jgi:hypothetical protein
MLSMLAYRITTLNIMTLIVTSLGIMKLSILGIRLTTDSIMTLSKMTVGTKKNQHNDTKRLKG